MARLRKKIAGCFDRGLVINRVPLVLLMASSASAASATFSNFDHRGSDAVNYKVTIDDQGSSGGPFLVTVEVIPSVASPNIGDITGVFFDLSNAGASDIHIAQVSGAINGPTQFDAKNLGNGVNLNGGSPTLANFDVGVKYFGFSTDDLQLVSFQVIALAGGLSLSDFTRFGVRSQTVGPSGGPRGGSAKEASDTPDPEPVSIPVPLPAAAWMGLSMLSGLGVFKKLRKRKHS